jgi:hypothetical protein
MINRFWITIKSFLVSVILFCAINSNAQLTKTISGSVVDSKTKEPIPFANISLKNALVGVASNENGNFDLIYNSELTNDIIVFSCLGFTSKELKLQDVVSPLNILLEPGTYELKEVNVQPMPPTYYIKQATKNLVSTSPKDPFITEAYYREKLKENDAFLKGDEAIFRTYYPNFQDTITNLHQVLLHRKVDTIKELAFMKSKRDKKNAKRIAKAEKKGKPIPEKEKEGIVANFGGPESILSQANLSKTKGTVLDSLEFKNYTYTFGPSTKYDNYQIMVINYKSKGKVDHARSNGKIFIDLNSYAIVKIERVGEFVIPLLIRPILFAKGLAIDNPIFSSSNEYQELEGRWYPKNIQFNLTASLIKKHWFDPNEQSDFEIESIFTVNKLKLKANTLIPVAKRYDSSKKMETQIFNDENLKWSEVNIIKKM